MNSSGPGRPSTLSASQDTRPRAFEDLVDTRIRLQKAVWVATAYAASKPYFSHKMCRWVAEGATHKGWGRETFCCYLLGSFHCRYKGTPSLISNLLSFFLKRLKSWDSKLSHCLTASGHVSTNHHTSTMQVLFKDIQAFVCWDVVRSSIVVSRQTGCTPYSLSDE